MHSVPTPVVLDTNTVMALWWFDDPRLHRLRNAVASSELDPLCRQDAMDELQAVLAYRQFGITPEGQQSLLQAYRRQCAQLSGTEAVPPLPRCRDRDDQKFLEIAAAGKATVLITRDKALLRLNRHRLIRPRFRIVTPERFCAELTPQEIDTPAQATATEACAGRAQKSYSSS